MQTSLGVDKIWAYIKGKTKENFVWIYETVMLSLGLDTTTGIRSEQHHVGSKLGTTRNTLSTMVLIHWGRVTHKCVSKLTIICSDNGLSPGRRQAIIWPNAGILLIGPLGTNFSQILIEIYTFSFKKMHLKMSSWKWRPFCLGLNELISAKRLLCLARCK